MKYTRYKKTYTDIDTTNVAKESVNLLITILNDILNQLTKTVKSFLLYLINNPDVSVCLKECIDDETKDKLQHINDKMKDKLQSVLDEII